jgi:hypothetical protein
MQAIEFTTQAHEGVIKIPEAYRTWFEKPLKVILLAEEDTETIPDLTEAFHLLTNLSDDFMKDGRQQPAMQVREQL